MNRFLSRWFSRWLRKPGAPSLFARVDTRVADAIRGSDHEAMLNAPMLDCESVIKQLWDYLDGELIPERMDAIRSHLEMCKRCYPQYEFERSFLHALAARQRKHSDQERLRTKLMAALQERGLSDV